MLINAIKKNGNRFLIWFSIGIPISAGLSFIQVVFLLLTFMEVPDPTTKNGMVDWKKSTEAKQMMKNPDWCTTETRYNGFDSLEILKCFKRDFTAVAKNEYKVIMCYEDAELGVRFNCDEMPSQQLTEEQILAIKSDK